MLGGVAGAEEYVGAAPTLDRVRLGWTRAPGDEPRWTAVAQEMDALATDTSHRGHEGEFTPTGLRGSLSSDRWAIRCKKCPLCGTRAMVALDNKGAMGLDRRHLIAECAEIQSATARRAAWTSLVAAARAVPAANTAFTGEVTRAALVFGGGATPDRDDEGHLEWRAAVRVLCGGVPTPGKDALRPMCAPARTDSPLNHKRQRAADSARRAWSRRTLTRQRRRSPSYSRSSRGGCAAPAASRTSTTTRA